MFFLRERDEEVKQTARLQSYSGTRGKGLVDLGMLTFQSTGS